MAAKTSLNSFNVGMREFMAEFVSSSSSLAGRAVIRTG